MPEHPSRNADLNRSRLHSFVDAFRGLGILLKTQANARIQLAVAVLAIVAGFGLRIGAGEWIAILFSIALVFALECVNTALEFLSDRVTTLQDPLIGHAKDMAAGAVLVASIAAAAVGAIVFGPKLLALIS